MLYFKQSSIINQNHYILERIENIGNTYPLILQVDEQAKRYLAETAKWAKLLAIVGFVGIAIVVILAIFIGFFMGDLSEFSPELAGMGGMMGYGISLLYIILAAIYFYPIWKLYQFATLTKQALDTESTELLSNALEAQKSMFKFMGILMIVLLGFYGLIFAIFGSALLSSMF